MENMTSFDQDLFQTIDRLMREDQTRVRTGFDKAAAFVNGIFCDLASIDVRFEFDPVSLDDCRCEKIAMNEYSVMCNLKQLPYGNFVLEGDAASGAVQVRLSDAYQDSYDKACWEDVCTDGPSGERYMNTRKLMASFYRAITTVLNCETQEGASIVCRPTSGHLVLIVNLHLAGVYKFHLLPAIKASRKCLTLKPFDEKIKNTLEVLEETDNIEFIQIVARSSPPKNSNTFWRITFNDLENRLTNLGKFACVRHCLFAVYLLQKNHLVAKGLPNLSLYNLQLLTLKELLKIPRTKDWGMDKLPERLDGLLKSVNESLSRKTNKNIFTEVNVLGNCRKKDVKLVCKEFENIRKFHAKILHVNHFTS